MHETNAEWSAIDFLRRNIIRDRGYTKLFVDAIEEVTLLAEQAQELEQQNSQLCVDMEFTQIANGGLKNLNKRMEKEIIRLREAINRSLKAHRWNNEESARILEEALAGETNGQRKA